MSTTTEKDVAALAAEIQQLRGDFVKIAELLQTTIRDAGGDAMQRARATGERAWAETKGKTEDIIEIIEKRPVASTAWAFGIGLLLGIIMHGRR